MKNAEINIRDPFVLAENGVYYLYGTRAKDFGNRTGGFDVYTSRDLQNWSEPKPCFDSTRYGMNAGPNWAPEVHRYRGEYYMFATFFRKNGRKGTYIMKAQKPEGPFVPVCGDALTPADWMCLDGTLYVDRQGQPWMIFCHEHTQIIDGTMCAVKLTEDLTGTIGEPITLFAASSPWWADHLPQGEHYVTDGPFLYRTKTGALILLWSSFINRKYIMAPVIFQGGELGREFQHQKPIVTDDGGHGMIFTGFDGLYITYHSPNAKGQEHPVFRRLQDLGDHLELL